MPEDALGRSTVSPTLAEKVRFLGEPGAYDHPVEDLICRETHMSWVFIAGERVYKLKKPVRFPYLDFSTLERRETMCRAELTLNRRLAPDVYLGLTPLSFANGKLSLRDDGVVVDWLVVMRRLDESQTLEHMLLQRQLQFWHLDRLVATLVGFYRRTSRPYLSPATHLSDWKASLSYNRRILLDPKLGLSAGLVQKIDRAQRVFLNRRKQLLAQRVFDRQIVDGHGDLRPEHIWLGEQVRIIDCLEFNARLRTVDPLDEIAFLSLECERLGNRAAGDYIHRRVARGLHQDSLEELFLFYRCHRATLRARLAIAHLLEPKPRTPEKWPRVARDYLRIAAADTVRLERRLRK